MGNFKDFDLDLKKVENNVNSGGASPDGLSWDAVTIVSTPLTEIILSIGGCPPNPSYGGDMGSCGPMTSANSRVTEK